MTYTDILRDMQNKYTSLTGCVPDDAGDIGIRFKVLAGEIADLYKDYTGIIQNAFPDTAEGEYLEKHAMIKNITRKPKINSRGMLKFSRDLPATSAITIPEGTICQTDSVQSIMFVTVQDGVIAAGKTEVEIPAMSMEGGSDKNVASGAVNLFATLIQGVSGVSNPVPFQGGSDEESDSSLRERLLSSYRHISNGANSAYYYQVAMEHPEVHSAKIIPRNLGRGTVAVVVAGKGVVLTQSVIKELQELFREKREIGVDVNVSSAVIKKVAIEVEYEGTQNERNDIASAINSAVKKTVLEQKVGEPLKLMDIYKSLIDLTGLTNFKVKSPSGDVSVQLNELVVLDGLSVSFVGN